MTISGDVLVVTIVGMAMTLGRLRSGMLVSILQFTGQPNGSFVQLQTGTVLKLRNPA